MIWTVILVVILLTLVIWATRTRMRLRAAAKTRSFKTIENSAASPLSTALGELIAIAGGIYLSLVLLESFLELSVPDTVNIMNVTIDPLAFLSIIIALVQPAVLSLYQRYLQ